MDKWEGAQADSRRLSLEAVSDPRGAWTERHASDCPFVPGRGLLPPHFAGREHEQVQIRNHLDRLQNNAAPGSDVIIYGPRGNGKTALLEWTLREAEARRIGTIDFSSKEIESTKWLAQRLAILPPWLSRLSGLSAFGVGIKTRDSATARISDGLARRARKHGLVFAIDEAHTLAIDAGQHLLHAVQRLGRQELPVMLLLAGTPDLPRHLNSMEASFWIRSRILPLGLLRPDAAADAIRIPLHEKGRSIADDALDRVVEESQGYPYFVQLWGELLWQETADPTRPTSLDDVGRARPRFENARNIYYRDRHVELDRAGLAGVAARLSLVFTKTDRLTDLEVDRAIGLALEAEGRVSTERAVLTARDRLHSLGYIWSAGGESRHCFRPGIPSLMHYVARSRDIDLRSDRA